MANHDFEATNTPTRRRGDDEPASSRGRAGRLGKTWALDLMAETLKDDRSPE